MVEVKDRVSLETETLGAAERRGTVVGVKGHLIEIRWDDGHTSSIIPSSGALRVIGHRAKTEAR